MPSMSEEFRRRVLHQCCLPSRGFPRLRSHLRPFLGCWGGVLEGQTPPLEHFGTAIAFAQTLSQANEVERSS
ncbi:hypothetical protein LY76DRAFT_594488 [Colletotrichum caudatum]|nr:hypothetical protein LY76DRAFT_594488 [Colletotrichum caudatum]